MFVTWLLVYTNLKSADAAVLTRKLSVQSARCKESKRELRYLGLCSGSFASGRVQNALAQAKRLWRRFHVLIHVDVFDRALQTHSEDSFKLNSFAFALAAHVREVLFLAWIDWQIFRTPCFRLRSFLRKCPPELRTACR